jgi:hypothetical protein
MKKITINLSYYNQVDVLRRHITGWESWSKDLLDQFSFCIVDDCSKVKASDIAKNIGYSNIDLSVYRVEKDLYCNIAGVRNLAAQQCNTDWMMIIDMDTVVSQELAESLPMYADTSEGTCFKFNRRVMQDPSHIKHNKYHPAVCMIRVSDYWKVGGCEEDLVGNYGYTDPSFWYRAKGVLSVRTLSDLYLDYVPAGEADINRDTENNQKLFHNKQQTNDWSTDFIRFPWSKEI